MKEYLKTQAIILECASVKENSASVRILTPDAGMISFLKHGFSSKKNIYRSLLQPSNLIEIHLEKQDDKYKLIDCSISATYDSIRNDYKKTTAVMAIFSTLIHSEIYDHKDYDLIYALVKKLLEALNNSDPCLLTVSAYFYYQLAWCLGTSFRFAPLKVKGQYYLDVQNGTFSNGKEPEAGDFISISKKLFEAIYNFRNIRFADIDKLNYITVNEFNEFRNMYKKYTHYHFCKAVLIRPAVIE